MKRSALITLVIFFSIQVNAQEFNAGVKAGWNLTLVKDIPENFSDFDISRRNSFHAGGYLEWYLSEKVAIVGEFLFSGKGAIIESTDSLEFKRETTVKLHYLTFPVLLQYDLGPLKLQAGPEFGLQLGENLKGYDRETGALSKEFWDNEFNTSVVGGIVLDLGNLFIGGRYGLSLTKFGEYTKTDINGDPTGTGTYGRHSFWQVSIGYNLL